MTLFKKIKVALKNYVNFIYILIILLYFLAQMVDKGLQKTLLGLLTTTQRACKMSRGLGQS